MPFSSHYCDLVFSGASNSSHLLAYSFPDPLPCVATVLLGLLVRMIVCVESDVVLWLLLPPRLANGPIRLGYLVSRNSYHLIPIVRVYTLQYLVRWIAPSLPCWIIGFHVVANLVRNLSWLRVIRRYRISLLWQQSYSNSLNSANQCCSSCC